MSTRSEVHMDPPGEGPATKVKKGARNGDERIVTRTNCVRVVKSKMPMCERPRASDIRHARSTVMGCESRNGDVRIAEGFSKWTHTKHRKG